MSQQELLKRVVQVLEDLSIEYMVTGSVSSSVQGEPRLTHDVDLVVDLSIDAAKRLCEAFVGDDSSMIRELARQVEPRHVPQLCRRSAIIGISMLNR
jgi:hypothetical protein